VIPTCEDRVDEIHRLLTKVTIDGRYILVGFSVGALWERIYAARYPDNIAGMIIVDHAFLAGASKDAPSHVSASGSSSRGYSPPVLLSKAPIDLGFEDNSNFREIAKALSGASHVGPLPAPVALVRRWQLIASPL
jgi:pimeloyl-ACP methyl ester carboxylesterase